MLLAMCKGLFIQYYPFFEQFDKNTKYYPRVMKEETQAAKK